MCRAIPPQSRVHPETVAEGAEVFRKSKSMTQPIPEPRLLPEVIAVVSQQNGAGKTTTAVNLAIALSAAGRTVLLIDLDPHSKTGHTLVRGRHISGAAYRLLMDAMIRRDMIAATEIPGLYLLPSDDTLTGVEPTLAMMGDSRTRLHQGLETLALLPTRFDCVVVDCPAALGLVSLNGLVAAHRVLIPVPCGDAMALKGLPQLLKMIEQLRAGFVQPLRGIHLLATFCSEVRDCREVIDRLRETYRNLCLQTEIPLSEIVQEANHRKRPVVVYCPRCEISRAYLALAAEWLTWATPHTPDDRDSLWRSKAFQDDLAKHHQAMQQRIEAWLLDPSSSLYDEDEDMHQHDAQVLNELFTIHQPPVHPVRNIHRTAAVVSLALAMVASGYLLWASSGYWAKLRLEAGALLIGHEQYWEAGSLFLARSDETAYRELILAARILADNRQQLMHCGERAEETGQAIACSIAIQPPHGSHKPPE